MIIIITINNRNTHRSSFTAFDLTFAESRPNVQSVLTQLLATSKAFSLNCSPWASSLSSTRTTLCPPAKATSSSIIEVRCDHSSKPSASFSDNDSLSALVSLEMSAQLLILLTDVPGVFYRSMWAMDRQMILILDTGRDAKVIDVFHALLPVPGTGMHTGRNP